ncbi:MAG: GNAT family N-acetyltransferase [Paucibacter sp.]|nr:GNAT family N-acetyltransferase [Roseateles sp.]
MNAASLRWELLAASALAQDDALRAAWNALNAERGDLPFMDASCIVQALRLFGRGDEKLAVGRAGAAVAALFVLQGQGPMRWTTFQPSQLPLGAWVATAACDVAALGRALMRTALAPCLVLSITQVDPQVAERPAALPDGQDADYIETGWLDLEGDFETYWQSRGKNLRQNLRKIRNRLEAAGTRVQLIERRSRGEMAEVVRQYGELESAGWKSGGGTAIHADNDQGRFYRALLEEAADRGEARVYEYRFDDQVVAMNLGLLRKGVLVVLKTTYAESAHAFSPAFLLRESELQQMYAEGEVRRMEYFGRFLEWHSRWTDRKRALYHLTLYRWSWLGQLAAWRRQAAAAKAQAAKEAAEKEAAAGLAADKPAADVPAEPSTTA